MSGQTSTQSRTHYFSYKWRARARNAFGEETGWLTNAGPAPIGYLQWHLPMVQETTSYRSRRRDPMDTESVSDLLSKYRKDYTIPLTDTGHEFSTIKYDFKTSHPFVNYQHSEAVRDTYFEYHGPLFICYPDTENMMVGEDSFVGHDDFDWKQSGAQMIKATYPTKSAASLGQFLVELKDGLPSVPGLMLKRGNLSPRSFGSEWLNFQFNLAPSMSDIQKIAASVVHSSDIIKQYIRDSGTSVRRKRHAPTEKTTVHTNDYHNKNGYDSNGFSSYRFPGQSLPPYTMWQAIAYQGGTPSFTRVDKDEVVTKNTWFSASYSYLLADGDSLFDKMERYEQLANKLLGTRLTVDTLYQLAPWSWLVDWFADIGTLIENTQALQQDGLVIRYGYLMHEYVRKVTYTGYNFSFGGSWKPQPISSTYTTTSKRRFRATPYGFGLNPDTFSGQQWSILAALGLTKAPKSLRYNG